MKVVAKKKSDIPAKIESELYALPEGWVWVSAAEACSSVRDGTHDTPEYVEVGVPLITSKNLINGKLDFDNVKNISIKDHAEISKRSGVDDGDILYAMIGTIGNPVIVRKTTEFSIKNVALFKSNESRIKSSYLKYWLDSYRFNNWLQPRLKGTTQKFAPLGLLRSLPIPLAPPEQQKQIVAKIEELFSHIDAGIDALKQSKKLLKQYRQSVLKAAVTGELSKEWREQNKDKLEPASKLLERILQERRQKWEAQQLEQFKAKGKVPKDEGWKDKYKEPELLENDFDVPESWVTVTLEAVADILSGFAFKSGDFSKNGVPAIKIANVSYGEFIWKQQEYLPTDFLEKHSEFSVKPGGILLALTRPITNGNVKACLYPQNAETALLNQRVCCIKEGVFLDKAYLLNVLQSAGFKRQVEDGVTETLQPNLSPNDLKKFYVLLPSLDEQRYIAEEVENKLSSQLVVEGSVDAELQRSERLKQSVLQSAFGGDLT